MGAKVFPDNNLSYQQFLERYQSTRTVYFYLWILLIYVFSFILQHFGVIGDDSQKQFNTYNIPRALNLIPMILHCYAIIQQKYFPSWRPQPFSVSWIGSVYILLLTVSSGYTLWFATTSRDCVMPLCEEIQPRNIQPYLLFQNIYLPVLATILIKPHHSWCVCLVMHFLRILDRSCCTRKGFRCYLLCNMCNLFLGNDCSV